MRCFSAIDSSVILLLRFCQRWREGLSRGNWSNQISPFVLVQGGDDCVTFSQTSGEMPSISAAFALFDSYITFGVSCNVGVLSNSVFAGCCEIRSIGICRTVRQALNRV